VKKIKTKTLVKKLVTPFTATGRYFANSWRELKNVHWPNRKSTWSMIFAVILFSGFFVVLITLLDIGFDKLFDLIIE